VRRPALRVLSALAFGPGFLASIAAHAWSIKEDRGNTVLIRCSDGSDATVGKSGGGWTVLAAGAQGKTGGQFAIVGQAALKACGE